MINNTCMILGFIEVLKIFLCFFAVIGVTNKVEIAILVKNEVEIEAVKPL